MNSSCERRLATMVNQLRMSFWPKNSSRASTAAALSAAQPSVTARSSAGRDSDGLRVARPTEDVVVRDCIVRAGALDENTVRAHCRARLAPYKIPKQVVFVDALPKTASGKVRRVELAAAAAPTGIN